jgi:chemotaxis response regulator CheB
VPRIKVVLEKMPPFVRELLLHVLRGESRLKVVGEASGNLNLLRTADQCKADVVVLLLPESRAMRGVCEQLLHKLPDLELFAVSITGSKGLRYHRKDIVAAPLPLTPLNDLLSALRSVHDR